MIGGIGGISQGLADAGLPSFIAFGVYVGEVIAPILVVVGWQTRIGAVLIAVNMLFAIGLVHAGEIFALGQSGGWALELQGLYLFSAIVVALIGPGASALIADGGPDARACVHRETVSGPACFEDPAGTR